VTHNPEIGGENQEVDRGFLKRIFVRPVAVFYSLPEVAYVPRYEGLWMADTAEISPRPLRTDYCTTM